MTNINTHIKDRDWAIRVAHIFISRAMDHLNTAVVHADAIDDQVHVERLSEIVIQLSAAREPLAEHIDWLEKQGD